MAPCQELEYELCLQTQSLQPHKIPEGVDVNSPTTWQQGDIIECVDDTRSEWVTEGKFYTCSKHHVGCTVAIEKDDYGYPSTPCALFKFVYRPIKK